MYKFEDHVDHYDDVFTSLSSAIDHMRVMIDCDSQDISKSHYTIIDNETGEIVSEYISDNYHLFTKANILKLLDGMGEYIRTLASSVLQQEQIHLWVIDDIRRCSKRLTNIANAMEAVLPNTRD